MSLKEWQEYSWVQACHAPSYKASRLGGRVVLEIGALTVARPCFLPRVDDSLGGGNGRDACRLVTLYSNTG